MKVKYKNWDEVNIKTYMKLKKVIEENTDPIDTEIGIMSVLCDCSTSEIEDLSLNEYSKIRGEVQWVEKMPESKPYCPKKVKLEKEYNVSYDISKLSVSQYIDYQQYIKMEDNIANVLSVFFVPVGKKYGEYNVAEVINDIEENMTVKNALNVCFFFTVQFMTLTKIILHSLTSKIKKTKNQKVKQKLTEILTGLNGVGLDV